MESLKQEDSDIVTLVAPSGGVVKDVPMKIGNLVVIPQITAAEAALFSGRTRGVFKLPKTASLALTAGRWVVWDVSAGKVDLLPDAAADFNLGRVRVDAASSDTEVEVVLDGRTRRRETLNFPIADVAAVADSDIRRAPFAGLITRLGTVLQGGAANGDAVVTGKIGATAITGGAVTITASGSAAGDLDEAYPTALNVVAKDDLLVFSSDGGGSTTRVVHAFMEIEEL